MPHARFIGLLAGLLAVGSGALACSEPQAEGEPYVAGSMHQLNDNGAWSWFMDERVIVHEGTLIVGSVRAVAGSSSALDVDAGNVEVAAWDLETNEIDQRILFFRLQQDDHNNPSFLPLANGGLVATYTKHGSDSNIYIQYSTPGDPLEWTQPDVFESPRATTGGHKPTYSNLFRLPSQRIINFYRGFELDPNYMYSDDEGGTWHYGGRVLHGRNGYSPYMKYCQDRTGAIHFVATEDHPRNYDTSLYHGIIDGDQILHSDGTVVAELSHDTSASARIWDLTQVFQADPDNVAWMTDIELDVEDRPVIAYSVQKDGRYSPRGQGGHDLRYGYARWDGGGWHSHEIAHAGARLYAGEDDYSGLATLDPQDPRIIYISTNADPIAGDRLISKSDGLVHYELFRGITEDDGATWDWEPITRDSKTDNLRPLVPRWDDDRTALVWMRGAYLSNSGDWSTAVVGLLLD